MKGPPFVVPGPHRPPPPVGRTTVRARTLHAVLAQLGQGISLGRRLQLYDKGRFGSRLSSRISTRTPLGITTRGPDLSHAMCRATHQAEASNVEAGPSSPQRRHSRAPRSPRSDGDRYMRVAPMALRSGDSPEEGGRQRGRTEWRLGDIAMCIARLRPEGVLRQIFISYLLGT